MAHFAASDARDRFSEVVELADSEAVFIERYGQPAAVLISPQRYELMMEALEELEDITAFDAAMADPAPNVSWEQAKTDLGWH